MTYLVVYYSRTGNNRAIAKTIAEKLSAEIDEIIDKKKRLGKLGWLLAGRDSRARKLTEIEFQKNPQDYDTIIIGSPIWDSVTEAKAALDNSIEVTRGNKQSACSEHNRNRVFGYKPANGGGKQPQCSYNEYERTSKKLGDK